MTNSELERAVKEFGQRCSNISRIYRWFLILANCWFFLLAIPSHASNEVHIFLNKFIRKYFLPLLNWLTVCFSLWGILGVCYQHWEECQRSSTGIFFFLLEFIHNLSLNRNSLNAVSLLCFPSHSGWLRFLTSREKKRLNLHLRWVCAKVNFLCFIAEEEGR